MGMSPAASRIWSRGAACPYRCTGIMQRVRGVIAFDMVWAVTVYPSDMSANTGVAPVAATALAVATYVKEGTTTSSPGFMSMVMRAACRAAVPELTATACRAPVNSRTARSSFWTCGPPSRAGDVRIPDSSTEATASLSASSMTGVFMGMRLMRMCVVGPAINFGVAPLLGGAWQTGRIRPGGSPLTAARCRISADRPHAGGDDCPKTRGVRSGLTRVDSISVSHSEPTGQFKSFTVVCGDMAKELVNATTAVVAQIDAVSKNKAEWFRGVNDWLDSVAGEMRGVKEEFHSVNDRLDVMEKTAQEGFERVGA